MRNTKKILGIVLALIVLTLAMSISIFADKPETDLARGYYAAIYNEDGTLAWDVDASKSASEFNVHSALEDLYVFADNPFLIGLVGTPSFELVMYEDVALTEDLDVTGKNIVIDVNGHSFGTNGYEITGDDSLTFKCSKGTGSVEGYTLNADGEFVESSYVATVNGVQYADIQEAIKAAAPSGTVTLLENIELDAPIVVTGTVVLDLAGYTINYTSTIQGEAMITNKGNLTINDSVGTGVIYYDYVGAADSSYGKGNYTISNGGTLTVNGGKITIANLRAHAKYPIDNNSTSGDAILVINGGHLYNYNTSAIRMFCNSTTNKNSVTINGGIIEGYCSIWVQNPGKNTVNGQLSITGGEIKTTAAAYVNGTAALKDVGSRIYFSIDGEGGAWSTDSSVSITGGTFNENVCLSKAAPAEITVNEEAASFCNR